MTTAPASQLFASSRRKSALSLVAGVLLVGGYLGAGAALVDGYVRPAGGLASVTMSAPMAVADGR